MGQGPNVKFVVDLPRSMWFGACFFVLFERVVHPLVYAPHSSHLQFDVGNRCPVQGCILYCQNGETAEVCLLVPMY